MPKIMQNFVINEMIYLYQKQKPCLDFHTWEVWIKKVNEIGCMIGGYMEWVNSREKQK